MTPLEQKMLDVMHETAKQRNAAGYVRWRYMLNWMLNVLHSQNPEFDAVEFLDALSKTEDRGRPIHWTANKYGERWNE